MGKQYQVRNGQLVDVTPKIAALDPKAIVVARHKPGEIFYSLLPVDDSGVHLVDGALLSGPTHFAFISYVAGLQTEHPNLFATESDWQASVTAYGVCGKFVYDSTNGTLRLPKVTGFVEGTIDPTAVSALVAAGLPNIEGALSAYYGGASVGYLRSGSGAFSVESTMSKIAGSGVEANNVYTTGRFSAAASNSIYGNSTTVQPQAVKGYVYIGISMEEFKPVDVLDPWCAVGVIFPYAGSTAPGGCLFCDGSAVSRTGYSELFSVIGTTYGAGDGSATFNLPDLDDGRFLEGSNVAGTLKSAGLPEISATMTLRKGLLSTNEADLVRNATGALVQGADVNVAVNAFTISGTAAPHQQKVEFAASASNPIYGNSNTVQPNSMTVRYCIVAKQRFSRVPQGSLTIEDTCDSTSVLNALSARQGNVLMNAVRAVAAPNTLTKITTSGTWTAPRSGTYRITCVGGRGGGCSAMDNNRGGASGGGGGWSIAYVELAIGESLTISIGAGGLADGTSDTGAGGTTTVAWANGSMSATGGGVGLTSSYLTGGGTGGTGNWCNGAGGNTSETFNTGSSTLSRSAQGGWPNGGRGGAYLSSTAPTNGGDGWVFIEYWTPSN